MRVKHSRIRQLRPAALAFLLLAADGVKADVGAGLKEVMEACITAVAENDVTAVSELSSGLQESALVLDDVAVEGPWNTNILTLQGMVQLTLNLPAVAHEPVFCVVIAQDETGNATFSREDVSETVDAVFGEASFEQDGMMIAGRCVEENIPLVLLTDNAGASFFAFASSQAERFSFLAERLEGDDCAAHF